MNKLPLKASQTEIGRVVREIHEATGMRLVIDADCPRCGWSERWFDGTVFGCNRCDYHSEHRVGRASEVPLVMTNQQCYDVAAPLGDADFRALARAFGFNSGEELQGFAMKVAQQ